MLASVSQPSSPHTSRVSDPKEMSANNRVFIIRHGESEANVANVIVSNAEEGMASYGLTDRGRQQTQEACVKLQELCGPTLSSDLVIISSDFKRTRETAEVIHQFLQPSSPLKLDPRLRERNFGSLDKTHSSNYQKVWAEDSKDANHTSYDCESVNSVFSRTRDLLSEVERVYQGKVVVLVSHGDTCQITLTAFRGLAPQEHKQLLNLRNCDIVELKHE